VREWRKRGGERVGKRGEWQGARHTNKQKESYRDTHTQSHMECSGKDIFST